MFFILYLYRYNVNIYLFECDFQLADYLICPGFYNVQFRFFIEVMKGCQLFIRQNQSTQSMSLMMPSEIKMPASVSLSVLLVISSVPWFK